MTALVARVLGVDSRVAAFMVVALWWRYAGKQALRITANSCEAQNQHRVGPIRMAMRVHTFGLALATVAIAGCATLGSHPPHATNLTGEWQLDESLSDDPSAVLREHMPHGGGMHHHGGMGGNTPWLTDPGGNTQGAPAS